MLNSPIIEKHERLTAHESSFFEHSTIVSFRPSASTTKSFSDAQALDHTPSLRKRPSHKEQRGFFDIFELHDRLPRNVKIVTDSSGGLPLKSEISSRPGLNRVPDRMTECFTLCKTLEDAHPENAKMRDQVLSITQVDSVWLASYRTTGKKFAVKFLWSPLRFQSVSHRRIIQSQVDIQRKLKHPYIARLSGFLKNIPIDGDSKLQACALITDYNSHGSLEDQLLLKTELNDGFQFFKEQEAQRIISQLCSALRYMHNAHHVVHCDVKLANILYDIDKQQIKLIDFGLAWNFAKEKNYQLHWSQGSHGEKQFLRKGTLNYLSPEQVKGSVLRSDVTKIDIWAVGVCACELVTGISPFARESELSTRQAILHGSINEEALESFQHLKLAQSFTQDCFEQDPNKRPSLDVLMKHPWLNWEKDCAK